MTTTQSILTVLAVVLGTMATRFLPFLIFPEGKNHRHSSVISVLSCLTPSSACWSCTV